MRFMPQILEGKMCKMPHKSEIPLKPGSKSYILSEEINGLITNSGGNVGIKLS